MYKVFENSFNICTIEFPLLATKKRKALFLKTVLSSFFGENTSIVGEINGLDFSVEKIFQVLETENLTISSSENGYKTLSFSITNIKDISIILSSFDCFSEGYYIIYIFSQCNYSLNELPIPLIDHELDGFLLKFSVHSDSTLLEFEFKDKSTYDKFISLVK